MLIEDDDSDDEETVLAKILFYAEEVVPNYNNRQFRYHFRLNPDTFENILQKLHSVQVQHIHSGHQEMNLEKQLLITIWYIANIECFRSVADRFGISKSSCWEVLYRVSRKLLQVNDIWKIISWPSDEKAIQNMNQFEAVDGFPGVVGAIDGSHIRILKPKQHPNSYFNRKGFHSILLQGVCDPEKLFMDVFVGVPGSVHDSRLLAMSDLSERIQNNEVTFPNNGHLIGDLAYPLSINLMVGFKDFGHLTPRQMRYNRKLSKTRVVIENAFAYLKGRFRRLKFMETVRLDLIALLVMVACILHNVCIGAGDDAAEFVDEIINVQVEPLMNHNDRPAALAKRNMIANMF